MVDFVQICFGEKITNEISPLINFHCFPLLLTYFVAHIYISYIISVHKAFLTCVFISLKYDNVIYRKESLSINFSNTGNIKENPLN